MIMTDAQFEQELMYQATMSIFKSMLRKGLITQEEYSIINAIYLNKYSPLLGTLLSEIA